MGPKKGGKGGGDKVGGKGDKGGGKGDKGGAKGGAEKKEKGGGKHPFSPKDQESVGIRKQGLCALYRFYLH